jgi:hypothetical protein
MSTGRGTDNSEGFDDKYVCTPEETQDLSQAMSMHGYIMPLMKAGGGSKTGFADEDTEMDLLLDPSPAAYVQ